MISNNELHTNGFPTSNNSSQDGPYGRRVVTIEFKVGESIND